MLRRLPKFEYFTPQTLEQACTLLSQYEGKARAIAGGTDLLLQMKKREATPQYLIGLRNIPGLDYINYDKARGLRIGALATIHAIETSAIIGEKFGILAQAASSMASTEIRNMGTIGGNLCSALPSADMAPPLLCLAARLKLVGAQGERIVPIEKFFQGPGETILNSSELLAEIQVPNHPPHSAGVYLKHTLRSAMDLAIISVGAVIGVNSTGKVCTEAKIALGVAAPIPMRARKAEEFLKGKVLEDNSIEETCRIAAEEAQPRTTIRGTAEYRREMIKVLTRRAVKQAWEKARPA